MPEAGEAWTAVSGQGPSEARRSGEQSRAQTLKPGRAAQRTEGPGILEPGLSSLGALWGQTSEAPTPAVC